MVSLLLSPLCSVLQRDDHASAYRRPDIHYLSINVMMKPTFSFRAWLSWAWLLWLLLLAFPASAQNPIETRSANFETLNQNMWGPSWDPWIFTGIEEVITDSRWNEADQVGSIASGIPGMQGGSFGGILRASTWGDFRLIWTYDSMTTGDVSVRYPIEVSYTIPDNGNIDPGDTLVIETDYTVSNGWALETNHPQTGRSELNFLYGMGFDVGLEICVLTCDILPLIPNLNIPITSSSTNPVPDTMNIFSIGQSGSEVLGLVYPLPVGNNVPCLQGVPPCVPGRMHFPSYGFSLPSSFEDAVGLTGSSRLPFTYTDDQLVGKTLQAEGDSVFMEMELSLFKLLSKFVPPPASVVMANLDGDITLPGDYNDLYGASVNWTAMRAAVEVEDFHRQRFSFVPEIYSELQFPTPMRYREIDPSNGQVVATCDTCSLIRFKVGNELHIKYPCHYQSMTVIPTIELENEFTNFTYDSIAFELQMKVLEFGITLPPVVIIPEVCVPRVCIPYSYVCSVFPFRVCTRRICTPSFCTPEVAYDGFNFTLGPLWQDSIPIGNISPITWYQNTWELEGFDPVSVDPFDIVARPYLAQIDSVPVPCFGQQSGQAILSITHGTPPYLIDWGNGLTHVATVPFDTIPNLAGGPQSAVITDANGCQVAASTYIPEPAAPLILLDRQVQPVSCANGQDGSIALQVDGGTPPYTFVWSQGDSSAQVSGLSAGTYTVDIFDANGCDLRDTIVVGQPAPLLTQGVVAPVSCFNGTDGGIQVQVHGGTPPYAFAWSSGQTTAPLGAIGAGSYTLTVTDLAGCVDSSTFVVPQPAVPLSATPNLSVPSCAGSQDGSIVLAPSGGTAPYQFQWVGTQGTPLASQDSQLTQLAGGQYRVLLTDANQCTWADTLLLNAPLPLATALVPTQVACFGDASGSIQIQTSGGTAPYSYQWSHGSQAANPSTLPAGTYTVTVTDAHNCLHQDSAVISQPDTALLVTAEVQDVACHGEASGRIELRIAGGTAPYSVLWANGATDSVRSQLTAGTYQATVTDQAGCTRQLSVQVEEPASPLAQQGQAQPTSCYGLRDGRISVVASGGTPPYQYQWADSLSQVLANTEPTLSPVPAGRYEARITDAQGCVSTVVYTVLQPEALRLDLAPAHIACHGEASGAIAASVAGGTPGYQYQWAHGVSGAQLSNLAADRYELHVTDGNGCDTSAAVTLTQPASPLQAEVSGQDIACRGSQDGVVSVQASGGTAPYAYQWSNGSQQATQLGLAPGTYTVTVIDSGGCVAQSGTALTQPAEALSLRIEAQENVSCYGAADGSLTLTAAGGVMPYRYRWGDSLYLLSEASERLTGLSPGLYRVTLLDANGCEVETSAEITGPEALQLTLTAQDATCYGQANGRISSVAQGGTPPLTYAWSDGPAVPQRRDLPAGVYQLRVMDALGCFITAEATVEQPDSLRLDTWYQGVSCREAQDGRARVAAVGGTPPYRILWSNGRFSPQIDSLPAGRYEVQVSDSLGCLAVAVVQVPGSSKPCFEIPSAFTPNGDGTNDVWQLRHLDQYPQAEVQIYDQRGVLLYQTQGQYRPWDGTYQERPLPATTYYYLIRLNQDEEAYTGPVTLVR